MPGAVERVAWSPTLAEPIALAYVPTPLAKLGSELSVQIRGRQEPASVVKRPSHWRG